MDQNRMSLMSYLFVVLATLAAGCLAGTEDEAEASPVDPDTFHAGDWTLHRTCSAAIDCAAERASWSPPDCAATCRGICHSTNVDSCGTCVEACVRSGTFHCSGEDGSCTGWSYEFTHENATPDPRIEAACATMFEACPPAGDVDVAAVCRTFAANEDPEIVLDAYHCYTERGCSAAECSLAPDDELADRVCVLYEGGSDHCGASREALAHDAAWWAQTTRDAALLCAAQPGNMRAQCVEAFLRATYAPTM